MLTLHDDESNEFQIVMNATSMFVPGSVIDEDNDKIKDQCYLAMLEHTKGPADTWFLGAPIINDYYTVFDMSPFDEHNLGYIQIGIGIENSKNMIGEAKIKQYNYEV